MLKKKKWFPLLIRIIIKKYFEVFLTVGFAKLCLNILFMCSNHFMTKIQTLS
jgi:hypothetical protein